MKSLRDESLYIGKTNDLNRRLSEHNSGQTSSTKAKRPYILLKSIPCSSEAEAIILEKEYKKGYKREALKKEFNIRRRG